MYWLYENIRSIVLILTYIHNTYWSLYYLLQKVNKSRKCETKTRDGIIKMKEANNKNFHKTESKTKIRKCTKLCEH